MEQFSKTVYEEYFIEGRFTRVLNAGEKLDSCEVSATDVNGDDATEEVIQDASTTVLDQGVTVGLEGGTEALEPYIITFKAVTDGSPANKWQLDVEMNIEATGS